MNDDIKQILLLHMIDGMCVSFVPMLEYNFIVIDTLHVALSLMAVPSTGAKVVLPMHCHLLVPSTPVLFVHVSMLW